MSLSSLGLSEWENKSFRFSWKDVQDTLKSIPVLLEAGAGGSSPAWAILRLNENRSQNFKKNKQDIAQGKSPGFTS